jgi:acyl-coenzyme A thioesterase PaaI-like protein
MLAVVEAQVYAGEEEKRDLVAKLNATMAVVRPG